MKRAALSLGVAALISACGGDATAPVTTPAPSHQPAYKIAAAFFDQKLTVYQSGASPTSIQSGSSPAEPVWSPDGTALAFARIDGRGTPTPVYSLRVWTQSGGVGAAIFSKPVAIICSRLGCSESYGRFDEAWSPDGKTLAFVADSATIGLVNADGTGSRTIPVAALRIGTVRWAPDGSVISFLHASSAGPTNDLLGITATSPYSQKIVAQFSDPIVSYDWSPDAKTLAVSGGDHVGLFAAGNSQAVSVLTLPTPRFVVWSPDGSRVAFAANVSNAAELLVVGKDGSGLRRVTYGSGFSTDLAWTSDGRDLIYSTGQVMAADVEGGAALSLEIASPFRLSVARK